MAIPRGHRFAIEFDSAFPQTVPPCQGIGFRNGFLLLAGIMVLLAAAHYLTSINGTVSRNLRTN